MAEQTPLILITGDFKELDAASDHLGAAVDRLLEGGGTILTLGEVLDGEFLQRSGSQIVGSGGGGGEANVVESLYFPASTAEPDNPGDVDVVSEVDQTGDIEVWKKATANQNNQSVDIVFPCLRAKGSTKVEFIKIPYELSNGGVGNNQVVFSVILADGTTAFTSTAQTGTTRTVFTIDENDLYNAQPAADERFLVVASMTLDSADIGRVGGVIVDHA